MNPKLVSFLVVMAGGALGSGLRYGLALLVAPPFGTLTVNVLGSFAMGLIVGLGAFIAPLTDPLRLFLTIGILGGFTTFSSFSADVLGLIQRGQLSFALGYIFLSLTMSLFAIFAGVQLVKAFS